MDIETLHNVAIYYSKKIKTNCEFIKIIEYREENGNYAFYAFYKCKKGIVLKKIILTTDGDLIDIISL